VRRWKNDEKQALRPASSVIKGALTPEVRKGLALAAIASAWPEVVGEKLARHTAPESVEKNVLTVVASTPAYAQEISMRGGTVARSIEKRWGVEITSVKARVGRMPVKRAPRARGKKQGVRVPQEAVESSRKDIENIPGRDDAKSALARLMALYRTRFARGGGKDPEA
jgi:hypothetical protein